MTPTFCPGELSSGKRIADPGFGYIAPQENKAIDLEFEVFDVLPAYFFSFFFSPLINIAFPKGFMFGLVSGPCMKMIMY